MRQAAKPLAYYKKKYNDRNMTIDKVGWSQRGNDARLITQWWASYLKASSFSHCNYYQQQAAVFTAAAFASCVPEYGSVLRNEITSSLISRVSHVFNRSVLADDTPEIAKRLVEWLAWLAQVRKIAPSDNRVINAIYALRKDLATSMGDPSIAGPTKRLVMNALSLGYGLDSLSPPFKGLVQYYDISYLMEFLEPPCPVFLKGHGHFVDPLNPL